MEGINTQKAEEMQELREQLVELLSQKGKEILKNLKVKEYKDESWRIKNNHNFFIEFQGIYVVSAYENTASNKALIEAARAMVKLIEKINQKIDSDCSGFGAVLSELSGKEVMKNV